MYQLESRFREFFRFSKSHNRNEANPPDQLNFGRGRVLELRAQLSVRELRRDGHV
jgi:hypothetical protein